MSQLQLHDREVGAAAIWLEQTDHTLLNQLPERTVGDGYGLRNTYDLRKATTAPTSDRSPLCTAANQYSVISSTQPTILAVELR